MASFAQHELERIALAFDIEGEYLGSEAYGSGHINDTYLALYRHKGLLRKYIHQRLNHQVFRNPPAVMENIQRVTRHLHDKLRAAGERDRHRKALTLVPTRSGDSFHHDQQGDFWRAYHFIGDTRSHQSIESPGLAREAGRAFGRFQSLLIDLPPPRLHETIPEFHHTPQRFHAFQEVLSEDSLNRASRANPDVQFALEQESMTHRLLDLHQQGQVPERVTPQRYQDQQPAPGSLHGRGGLRDRSGHGDAAVSRSMISETWCARPPAPDQRTNEISQR